MTDARMPETYLLDRRINRLTDSEFRAFVTATIWAVANRTDGTITPEDLPLIPRFAESASAALVDAGLWVTADAGWMIADFELTQTTSEQLAAAEQARAKARDKKRRQRANDPAVPPPVPRDVPRDNTGQDRTGLVVNSPVSPSVNGHLVAAASKTKRGTRIPENFTVTPEMAAWAREHTPLVDGRTATDAFRDYWKGKAGRDGLKLDWVATWRNWMRRDQEQAKNRTAPKPWEKPVGRPMTLAEERARYLQEVS